MGIKQVKMNVPTYNTSHHNGLSMVKNTTINRTKIYFSNITFLMGSNFFVTLKKVVEYEHDKPSNK